MRRTGWKALKIGEEPIFALADYAPRGNRTKKVRSAANQARKRGTTVEAIAAGQRPSYSVARDMEEVQAAWQGSRNISALAFTLGSAHLEYADDKVILIARREGRIEGFVTCLPAAKGENYYIEDMIRRPDAPNGVSELLFLSAVDECEGARGDHREPGPRATAQYGTPTIAAPLHGPRVAVHVQPPERVL